MILPSATSTEKATEVRIARPVAGKMAAQDIVNTTERRSTVSTTEFIVSGNGLPTNIRVVVNPWLSVIDTSANTAKTWYLLPEPNRPRPAAAFRREHQIDGLPRQRRSHHVFRGALAVLVAANAAALLAVLRPNPRAGAQRHPIGVERLDLEGHVRGDQSENEEGRQVIVVSAFPTASRNRSSEMTPWRA